MNMETPGQPRAEVVELERLIDNAEKSFPQLWAAIEKSISVAELASGSIQMQGDPRLAISQGTTTSAFFAWQELA